MAHFGLFAERKQTPQIVEKPRNRIKLREIQTEAAREAAQAPAQTVRVGTFHKASIVVAFCRSPLWAESLKAKMAEMAAAKAANDNKRVQELDAWGNAHQETAHRQLTG